MRPSDFRFRAMYADTSHNQLLPSHLTTSQFPARDIYERVLKLNRELHSPINKDLDFFFGFGVVKVLDMERD